MRSGISSGVLRGLLILGVLSVMGCHQSESPRTNSGATIVNSRPTIVFMTDFGSANDAAAICRAVMVGIAPEARIMDVTHQVTPFSVEDGARMLSGVAPYYPAGTVFVVVIDPGVGTSCWRRTGWTPPGKLQTQTG